jgi:hypothetical protein
MSTASKIDTPELDKRAAVLPEIEAVKLFIHWLRSEKKMSLCEWMEWANAPAGYYPTGEQLETLLAEYHGIDLAKAEAERNALLDRCRQLNESGALSTPDPKL